MANITKRTTDASQNKGQISTQEYTAQTIRTVTSSPPSVGELRTQIGTSVQTNAITKGDVTETKTSTGVGSTSSTTEDKGVVLKFRIQIQQRNPVLRA